MDSSLMLLLGGGVATLVATFFYLSKNKKSEKKPDDLIKTQEVKAIQGETVQDQVAPEEKFSLDQALSKTGESFFGRIKKA